MYANRTQITTLISGQVLLQLLTLVTLCVSIAVLPTKHLWLLVGMAGLLAMSPLLFRLVNERTLLFVLIVSLILEKYQYYVGFSIRVPMLIIPFFILCFLIQSLLRGRFRIIDSPFYKILPLLFLVYCVGAIWAINPINAVRVSILYLFLFALFFITHQFLDTDKRINLAIKYFLITGILGSVYGIYQVFGLAFGLPWQLPFIEYLTHGKYYFTGLTTFAVGNSAFPRINSTFNDPVLIGCFSAMSLMLLLSRFSHVYFDRKVSKSIMWKYFIGAFILITCLILTFSRSAWLGAMIGFCVLSFYWLQNIHLKKFLFRAVVCSLLIGFVLILAYPPLLEIAKGRVMETFDLSHVSTAGHLKWLLIAIHAVSQNPLFGVGLNNFGEFYAVNYQSSTNAMTHSAYLSFLAETGIVGFVLEMTFIFMIIRYLLSAIYRAKKIRNEYYYFTLIGLLSAYFVMLGSNITYHFYTQFYVWFFNGLAVATSTYVLKQMPKEAETQ